MGNKHLFHKWEGDGRQTISVKGGANDEEEDGTKANIFVKETRKLSTEARILRGSQGPKILVN